MVSQSLNIQTSCVNLWSSISRSICISTRSSSAPVCFLATRSKHNSSECIQHFMSNIGSNISFSLIRPNLEMPPEDISRQSGESSPSSISFEISSMVSVMILMLYDNQVLLSRCPNLFVPRSTGKAHPYLQQEERRVSLAIRPVSGR